MSNETAEFAKYVGISDVSVSPDSFVVVPSDTADLPHPVRALRANASGVVACVTAGSKGATRLMNFAAGETRMVLITRVLASGTTADGLEGMP